MIALRVREGPPTLPDGKEMVPIAGDTTLSIDAMMRAGMLRKDQKKRYVWKWGTEGTSFMVLPSDRVRGANS